MLPIDEGIRLQNVHATHQLAEVRAGKCIAFFHTRKFNRTVENHLISDVASEQLGIGITEPC
jgi:hypothetical protein